MPFDLLQDMSGLKAVVKATLADLEGLRAELAARQNR